MILDLSVIRHLKRSHLDLSDKRKSWTWTEQKQSLHHPTNSHQISVSIMSQQLWLLWFKSVCECVDVCQDLLALMLPHAVTDMVSRLITCITAPRSSLWIHILEFPTQQTTTKTNGLLNCYQIHFRRNSEKRVIVMAQLDVCVKQKGLHSTAFLLKDGQGYVSGRIFVWFQCQQTLCFFVSTNTCH